MDRIQSFILKVIIEIKNKFHTQLGDLLVNIVVHYCLTIRIYVAVIIL